MSRLDRVTLFALLGALVGSVLLWHKGLDLFALNDYATEAKPAMRALMSGDVGGYLERLPGYGGAMMLESPFALFARGIDGDQPGAIYQGLAVPGMVLLGILGLQIGRRVGEGRGAFFGPVVAAGVAALVAGCPIALLALQYGHPEELLVSGLVVASIFAAMADREMLAGIAVGLAAAGKPWALIAVPVVLVSSRDIRRAARISIAAATAAAVLVVPMHATSGVVAGNAAMASSSATGIFKPTSVFWFLGSPNPRWDAIGSSGGSAATLDAATKNWAQRLEPGLVGTISHPLIVLVALVLSAVFLSRREASDRRGPDLLLLLALVCWWRCLLDTWNVHYYALAAVLALIAWEATRRRVPILGASLVGVMWLTFRVFADSGATPDAQAAVYLAWAVPAGVAMAWRLLVPSSAIRAGEVLLRPLAASFPTFVRALRGSPARS